MKVLIFGSTGFIGKAVLENLSTGHEVYTTTRSEATGYNEYSVDLLKLDAVRKVIELVRPEVIINAAGIVDPNADTMQNVSFTKNILQATSESENKPHRVIIFGSAGEYGHVLPGEIPVSEEVPLRASSGYGYAKKIEEQTALTIAENDNLPIVIARIFNPIGLNMAEKFLVSRLKKQINEYKQGTRNALELSRKDAERDYIAVDDIASAIRCLIEASPMHSIYNIGSGSSMSNDDLLKLMIDSSKLEGDPRVIETSSEPEQSVASRANIARITHEFNWIPQRSIAAIVEEIMND